MQTRPPDRSSTFLPGHLKTMDHVQDHEPEEPRETLKDQRRQIVSPERNISLNIWDSNESDTESLAEERVYQQALLKRIDGQIEVVPQAKDDDDSSVFKHMEKQDLDYTEEYLDVYDSLEAVSHRPDQMNGSPVSSISDSEVTSDRYSDLRYDPNWRANLREAGKFDRVRLPQNTEARSEESQSDREGRSTRGGYSYAIVPNPVLSEHVTSDRMDNRLATQRHFESYHLHPQERVSARENPPHSPNDCHEPSNHIVTSTPRKTTHLRTNTPSERDSGRVQHRNDQVKQVGTDSTHPGHHQCRSPLPEQGPQTGRRHRPQFETSVLLQREATTGQTASDKELEVKDCRGQRLQSDKELEDSPRQKVPQQVSKRKTDKPKEDIIQRNRTTLGVQAAKRGGSYLKAHSLKGEKSDTSSQVTETSDDLTTAGTIEGDLEESPDPELRWLLQAQRLRVTQMKAQRRGNPTEKRPLAPGGQARQRDCLSPATSELTARGPRPQPHLLFPQPSDPPAPSFSDSDSTFSSASPSHPGLQPHLSPSHPGLRPHPSPSHPGLQPHPSPSIHLHINLHSELPPLVHQSRLDLTSTSHLHAPLLVPYHGVTLAASPGPLSPPAQVPSLRLGVPARLSPSGVGMAAEPSVWSIRSQGASPASWPGNSSSRSTSPRWHLFCPDNQNQVVHVERSSLHPPESHNYRPPVDKQHPGASAVLPPIGHQMTGHPAGGQGNGSPKTSVQRTCSDGYLAHMDKQRQLKERCTYKAYTLKDYQRLKQDLKLGGLGPVYTVDDVTVEKMRRQKLYSNVIREQNKMRSRLPILPARKPVGQDKKEEVPRKKALEYAKSIPRPVPPSKPPPRERGEGVPSDRVPYLEGVDLSQLAALELLRKRHEEERAAVAHFNVLHAV